MVTGNKVTVVIETNTPTRSVTGSYTAAWATTETISKAVLVPKKGNERFIMGKDNVISTHTLFLNGKKRNRSARSITEGQRITFNSRIFDIVYVTDVNSAGNVLKLDLTE